jgi:lipid II isoglutaminyl synthase (glutamine-hydrolysing)
LIKLGTIFPNQLNLDGDQGNLLALKRYLTAAGFQVDVQVVSPDISSSDLDFVLFGHGSLAACESLASKLDELDWLALLKVPGLAVGSGFEYLSRNSIVPQMVQPGERESAFQVANLGNLEVLGYRNTDSGLPNLSMNEQWICTMLHGPVLAKNPKLLDRAAKAAVAAAGLEWPQEQPDQLKDWVENLNRISEQVWKIETEKPFQKLAI